MFPKASMWFTCCGYCNTVSLIYSAYLFTHFSLFHFPSLFQIPTLQQNSPGHRPLVKRIVCVSAYAQTFCMLTPTHRVRRVLYTSPSTAFKEPHMSRTQSVVFGFKPIGSSEMTPWGNPEARPGWEDISKFMFDSGTLNEVLTLSWPQNTIMNFTSTFVHLKPQLQKITSSSATKTISARGFPNKSCWIFKGHVKIRFYIQ